MNHRRFFRFNNFLDRLSEPVRRMIDLPRDFPVIERSAVRLVVLDGLERVLLFHTHDPEHPDLGRWWELPGGGIDPGETYVDATVREPREETGLEATANQVGPASWRRRASFIHRRTRHLQDEVVVTVRLDGTGLAIDESHRQDTEREDYCSIHLKNSSICQRQQ